MCGRYSLTTPVEGLRELFDFPERPNLQPRYNIAPTQEVAAVRAAVSESAAGDEGGGTEGSRAGAARLGRQLALLRWGLIPSWAKDPAIGARLINARAETLAEKPAFRAAFKARRCLVPADGFYEWQKREQGPKQPFHIARRDGAPFAFAGLWERWRGPRGGGAEAGEVESCTIVTRDATAALRAIHHRMPVILGPESYDLWLDPATPAARLASLLAAEPALELTATAISTRVNKVANDDAEVLRPLAGDGGAAGEFGEAGDGQAKLL